MEKKLYVWEGVLCDYTDGIAFALAESPEKAAEMLKKEIGGGMWESAHWEGIKLDGVLPVEKDCGYCWGGG